MGTSLLSAGVLGLAIFLLAWMRKDSRIGTHLPLDYVYKKGKSAAGILGQALVSLVGFLAYTTKTSNSNEATENAASGGVLNFRTGKLDDGTDPVGWYDRD
jgi:hypothetical protein